MDDTAYAGGVRRAHPVRRVLQGERLRRLDAEAAQREQVEVRLGLGAGDVVRGADGREVAQKAEPLQVTGDPGPRRAGGKANLQPKLLRGGEIGDDPGERRDGAELGAEARSDLLADGGAVDVGVGEQQVGDVPGRDPEQRQLGRWCVARSEGVDPTEAVELVSGRRADRVRDIGRGKAGVYQDNAVPARMQ